MSEAPILTCVEGGWGRIPLNRPTALHALTLEMCRLMTEALLAWRGDATVQAVMIDHMGERGFCAGGDIRMIAESGAGDGVAARAFFAAEYRLNTLLFEYAKPVVALMDGIVMGGGVGISAPARYRVATERTVFAMPETGIGLFPDVGGGWFLPRLPGAAGMWLALTGARIKAADCLLLGLATDYVESGRIAALKAELLARPGDIETVLTEFEADAGSPPMAEVQDEIDRTFSGESVEAVVEALKSVGSSWSTAQLEALKTKSPLTLKVAFRQLGEGAQAQSFAEEMAREYRIACRVALRPDFKEGVRAVIVDRDTAPKWNPANLDGVSDAMLDDIFAPLPVGEEWMPLT